MRFRWGLQERAGSGQGDITAFTGLLSAENSHGSCLRVLHVEVSGALLSPVNFLCEVWPVHIPSFPPGLGS